MALRSLARVLFIIYCVEAGALLVLAPWGAGWERTMLDLTVPGLRALLLHPAFRGAVSGFGIVHLVWAAHDLDLLLAGWKTRGAKSP